MKPSLRISDLARQAEVPVSTVRYYERSGLLTPPPRSASNYRMYSSSELHRLRFIRIAQSAGFTLSDIKHLLDLRDGEIAPCAEVRVLIERRLEGVDKKLDELKLIKNALREFHDICEGSRDDDPCGVMNELDSE